MRIESRQGIYDIPLPIQNYSFDEFGNLVGEVRGKRIKIPHERLNQYRAVPSPVLPVSPPAEKVEEKPLLERFRGLLQKIPTGEPKPLPSPPPSLQKGIIPSWAEYKERLARPILRGEVFAPARKALEEEVSQYRPGETRFTREWLRPAVATVGYTALELAEPRLIAEGILLGKVLGAAGAGLKRIYKAISPAEEVGKAVEKGLTGISKEFENTLKEYAKQGKTLQGIDLAVKNRALTLEEGTLLKREWMEKIYEPTKKAFETWKEGIAERDIIINQLQKLQERGKLTPGLKEMLIKRHDKIMREKITPNKLNLLNWHDLNRWTTDEDFMYYINEYLTYGADIFPEEIRAGAIGSPERLLFLKDKLTRNLEEIERQLATQKISAEKGIGLETAELERAQREISEMLNKIERGEVNPKEITEIAESIPEVPAAEVPPVKPVPKPPAQKEPLSLARWVKKKGGINEEQYKGEVQQMFSLRAGYNLINKKTGRSLDELREMAIEEGYLPEGAGINTFINLLDEDVRAIKQTKKGAVFREQDVARQAEREFGTTFINRIIEEGEMAAEAAERAREISKGAEIIPGVGEQAEVWTPKEEGFRLTPPEGVFPESPYEIAMKEAREAKKQIPLIEPKKEITGVGAKRYHPEETDVNIVMTEGRRIENAIKDRINQFSPEVQSEIRQNISKIDKIFTESDIAQAEILRTQGKIPAVEYSGIWHKYISNRIINLADRVKSIMESKLPESIKNLIIPRLQQEQKQAFYQLRRIEDGAFTLLDEEVQRLAKVSQGLSPERAKALEEALKDVDKLIAADIDIFKLAMPFRNILQKAGQKLVQSGLLSDKTFQEELWRYLPQFYKYWEKQRLLPEPQKVWGRPLARIEPATARLLERQITVPKYTKILKKEFSQLPLETTPAEIEKTLIKNFPAFKHAPKTVRKEEIINDILNKTKPLEDIARDLKEFIQKEILGDVPIAYTMAKGGRQLSRLAFRAQLTSALKGVRGYVLDSLEGIPENIAKDYVFVPAGSKRYGALAGKYVQRWIMEDFDQALDNRTFVGKFFDEFMGLFKRFKTVWNFPGTWFRNFYWNIPVSAMRTHTGYNPFKIAGMVRNGLKEVLNQSDLYFEARLNKTLRSTFSDKELDILKEKIAPILDKPVSESPFNYLKIVHDRTKDGIKTIDETLARGYGLIDDAYKMGYYKHLREVEGLSPQQASREVLSTYGDYSAEATPGIIQEASRYIPFIKFPASITPRMLTGAIINHPVRTALFPTSLWLAKEASMKINGITDEEWEQLTKDLSWYHRQALFPLHKDEKGKIQTIDLTYLIPYIGSSEFMRTGILEPITPPVVQMISDIRTGRIGYLGPDAPRFYEIPEAGMISREGLSEYGKILSYLAQTVGPTLTPPIPGLTKGGYQMQRILARLKGEPMTWQGYTPTLMEDILYPFGLKIRTYEPEVVHRTALRREERKVYGDIVPKIKGALFDRRLSQEEAEKEVTKVLERLRKHYPSYSGTPAGERIRIRALILQQMLENLQAQGYTRKEAIEAIEKMYNLRKDIQLEIREEIGKEKE